MSRITKAFFLCALSLSTSMCFGWTIAPGSSHGTVGDPVESEGYNAWIYAGSYGADGYAHAYDGPSYSEAGGTTISASGAYKTSYVTPANDPQDCEHVHYRVAAACTVRVYGDASDGVPITNGAASGYGYANAIANAGSNDSSDNYNSGSEGKVEVTLTANEATGWGIAGSKEGGELSYSGAAYTFDETNSADIDKEANMKAKGAFCKVTHSSKVMAKITQGGETSAVDLTISGIVASLTAQ